MSPVVVRAGGHVACVMCVHMYASMQHICMDLCLHLCVLCVHVYGKFVYMYVDVCYVYALCTCVYLVCKCTPMCGVHICSMCMCVYTYEK